MIRLVLLLTIAAVVGAADDQIWPLAENRTDTIYFVDGDPMFGTLLEEDGKRFLINDKGGKFELRAGTVDHIEPKRLAAQPFLRPSYEAKKQAAAQKFSEVIEAKAEELTRVK